MVLVARPRRKSHSGLTPTIYGGQSQRKQDFVAEAGGINLLWADLYHKAAAEPHCAGVLVLAGGRARSIRRTQTCQKPVHQPGIWRRPLEAKRGHECATTKDHEKTETIPHKKESDWAVITELPTTESQICRAL